jgi:hypothetical protein
MKIVKLSDLVPRYRSTFEELLRETWQQTWSNELAHQIVQWRYYERPGDTMTWVAMDDDRCVALLDSFLRPYLYNGQRILVRETADWYCMPKYRAGLGITLVGRFRKQPEPIFVLGGSRHTVEIVTAMRWLTLPPASSYVLPLSLRGLAGNLIRRRWRDHEGYASAIPKFVALRRPRHINAPSGHSEIRLLTPHDSISIDPSGPGLVQLLETSHWQWLARMPHDLGEPIGMLFLLDGRPAGVTIAQIEPAASGVDAKIVHVQCSEPAIGPWMISATAEMLASRGVDFIRCYVSSAAKIAALEQVGFLKSKTVPCFWLPNRGPVPTSLDVSYLRGDDSIPFQQLRGRAGQLSNREHCAYHTVLTATEGGRS